MNTSTPHLPPLPETADIAERDLLGGLEKGLRVIEAFDQDRPRLTISEVALRTGLSRAAVRRCLLTLVHLGYGLAAILGFIGGKLVLHWAHTVWLAVPEVPTLASLGVIVTILVIVVCTSLWATRNERKAARVSADR